MAGPIVNLDLGPSQSAKPSNPLEIMGSVADLQSKINQNKLFAQQWAARQAAGKIIAGAADEQSAYEQLRSNPLTAAYANDLMAAQLQNRNAMLTNEASVQSMGNSALAGLYQGLAPALSDPSKFEDAWKVGTANIPKSTQEYFAQHGDPVGTLHGVLGNMAKTDPEGFKKFVSAAQLMTVSPAQVFGASGNVPPTLQSVPGGGYAPYGGIGQQGQPATEQGQAAGEPAVAPQATTPAPTPATAAAASSPTVIGTAGNGTPLALNPAEMPSVRKDASGQVMWGSDVKGAQVLDQQKKFNDEQGRYDQAANAIGYLNDLQANVETLASGGGWMSPGPTAAVRTNLANTINAIQKVVSPDSAPMFDPTKVAASENFGKDSVRLGFQLASSMFGGGREPLGVVQNAMAAVPTIENSPLGAMLLSDTLKASLQWQLDQREFKQAWMSNPQTGGDLTGADTAFAKRYPPSSYMQKVLDKYGIGKDGLLESSDAILNAYKSGLINKEIAYTELYKLGPDRGGITEEVYKNRKNNTAPDWYPVKAGQPTAGAGANGGQ